MDSKEVNFILSRPSAMSKTSHQDILDQRHAVHFSKSQHSPASTLGNHLNVQYTLPKNVLISETVPIFKGRNRTDSARTADAEVDGCKQKPTGEIDMRNIIDSWYVCQLLGDCIPVRQVHPTVDGQSIILRQKGDIFAQRSICKSDDTGKGLRVRVGKTFSH
jgi:hypothetical protein